MTRKEIFDIMGKFYGNAYFGHYNEETWTGPPIDANYLVILKGILDEFNSLGYHVSNIHALSYIEDKRFVKIIVDNVNRYGRDGPMDELIYVLNRLSYHEATPDVLKWHQDPRYQHPETRCFSADPNWFHFNISTCAYQIRNKKYMSMYMDIVRSPDYGTLLDRIIEIPLVYKNREALEILIKMQEKYGIWGWIIAEYLPRFKDPGLIPELEKLLLSTDSELKKTARKQIEKLSQ